MERSLERCKIYLTDQLVGRPNVKTMSREIMLAVTDFYKNPLKAEGFREKTFTDWHHPAWDSGGFQFLMGKLDNPDPMKTIAIYKKIGVKPQDFPIQLDLPPRYDLSSEERLNLIHKSALFYWKMVEEIPFVIPVVHGWTSEELVKSLELIDDPDKLASPAFIQSGRYVLDEAGNLKKPLGTGSNLTNSVEYALDHVTSNKSVSVGSYHVTNVAGSKEPKVIASPYPSVIDAGIVESSKTASRSAARKRNKVVATPIPSNADIGWKNTILTNNGMKKKDIIASGTFVAETTTRAAQREVKQTRVPINIIIERLATVLNLLRDRDLFMLGGSSPHMQHLIFLGGAKYSDTSAWRLKGYFGEIYLPELGARSLGYKDTSQRLHENEKPVLKECLDDPSHPFEGMAVDRFIKIGHMNITEWKETWQENKWEVKPFPLRALHNAWVLKKREEIIANQYATDPDRYYKYLEKRFKKRPQLTKRLDMLWTRLRRPWVQTQMGIYLKGGNAGIQ